MTQPTRHIIADALHILADLVAAGKVNGCRVEADPWQAERLVTGLDDGAYAWTDGAGRRHWNGTLMGGLWLLVNEVPSTVLADAFDQEAGR